MKFSFFEHIFNKVPGCTATHNNRLLSQQSFRIRIRKSFIAKCVYTHKECVLVLGASSTEVQT